MIAVVSCPDWSALAAWRASRDGEEPAGWQDALAHLDTCRHCRDAALAADPSLLFRRLPALPEALDLDDEVASVQQAVAAMRTASRLEREQRPRATGPLWKRWAAAAAIAATAGLGLGTWYELPAREGGPSDFGGWTSPSIAPISMVAPAAHRIEDVDRPNVRVLEFGGENRQKPKVVGIYDPNFDVLLDS